MPSYEVPGCPVEHSSSLRVLQPCRTGRARTSGKRRIPGGCVLETGRGSEGILSVEMKEKREEIIELLKQAYFMELETVINYVTNATNPDGVRAQEVKESLEEDIQEELSHAQQFASRIKE